MENEIKVGDFIRTRCGHIRRVTKICPYYENDLLMSDSNYIELDGLGDISTYKSKLLEEIIVKHSPNIIDLIEVGDFVNGHLVIDKAGDGTGAIYTEKYTTGALIPILEKNIQTIVTKEMMEFISYKVKQEEN